MKHFILGLFSLFAMQSYADCPGMSVSISTQPATCSYAQDGQATAVVTGGSGNYSYSFVNSSYGVLANQSGNQALGMMSGNYFVIVNDITNGCADTTAYTIVAPSPLVATVFVSQPVLCAGSPTGALQVIPTGGTPPYVYNWNNGVTTQVASNLMAGVYVVTVIDANGCMTQVTGVLTDPTPIFVNSSSTPANCNANDGTATIIATGGFAPYQYSIDGGATFFTSNQFTNLPTGTYQVMVMDSYGCVAYDNVTVGNASGFFVTATSTPAACSPCNGSVTVNQSGGTAPYTYEISGFPPQSSNIFTGVCPGPYVVTATDNSGCTALYTVMVNPSGLGGASVNTDSINPVTGYGLNNGFIELTVNGPNPPYTFSWSNGAITEDIYSLPNGTYSVVITDATGNCQTFYYTVNLQLSYGIISGTVYNDDNSNCINDAGDLNLANYLISASDGVTTYYGYSNYQGFYSIWVPIGNYDVNVLNTNNLSGSCSNTYNITVNTNSNNTGNDFAYSIPPIHDVCISGWSSGIVPGFNGTYMVYVQNVGNQPASGTACFHLPSPLTYLSASPSPISVINDTICFSFSNVAPGTYAYYYINFNTPVSLPLGTPMVSCMNATLTSGTDANPSCNYYCYTRVVSGSFDPNDKSVSPMGENGDGDIYVNEDEFTYLIRFQNTGTGPAVNVLVTDTLSALLDITSLEVLDASHDYVVEMINNTLRFRFNNIMLPDSNSNEPASHGHIQFRLSTLNAPAIGQEIENTANIYFDFNEPVITNTTHNEYVSPVSVEEESTNGLLLYPNPANQVVYLQSASNLATQVELMDLSGRIIHSGVFSNGTMTIPCDKLAEGVYFIHTTTNGTTKTIKLIVQH